MAGFRDLELRVTQAVFRHLGDDVVYTFAAGGSVSTRVQVYERPNALKDDSVRGLAAATSRMLSAAETISAASLLAADVPAPKPGDSFIDQGATYYVEHILERTPSRIEVALRRG